MSLSKLLSVAGRPGLYRLAGQMKNGIIVEAIDDGKRFPVYGSAKVSALEEISIYTEDEDMPLDDVFARMFEKEDGKAAVDHKDTEAVKAYFGALFPEFDKERVYTSDLVKVAKWYNQLIENNAYEPGSDEEEETETTSEETSGEEKKKASKPKAATKKAPAKKAAPKKATAKPQSKGQAKAKSTPRKMG